MLRFFSLECRVGLSIVSMASKLLSIVSKKSIVFYRATRLCRFSPLGNCVKNRVASEDSIARR